MGVCGIFFDPPYGDVGRDKNIYAEESSTVAAEVSAWAVKRGSLPSYRIVVAGYDGEHQCLIDAGWRVHEWSAMGGYAKLGGKEADGPDANRHRERLFMSPHCLKLDSDMPLFDFSTSRGATELSLDNRGEV
jgi:DNA adenine methylase